MVIGDKQREIIHLWHRAWLKSVVPDSVMFFTSFLDSNFFFFSIKYSTRMLPKGQTGGSWQGRLGKERFGSREVSFSKKKGDYRELCTYQKEPRWPSLPIYALVDECI